MPVVFDGGAKVGKGVGSLVGWEGSRVGSTCSVPRSGRMEVGVAVAVANRSSVGIRVTVGAGVKVSVGGAKVGVVASWRSGAKLASTAQQGCDQKDRQDLFHRRTFWTIRD